MQVSVLKEWIFSLLLSLIIILYGIYFKILLQSQTIEMYQLQNETLQHEVQSATNNFETNQHMRGSDGFYRWFATQNFTDLKLRKLADNQKQIQVILSGPLFQMIHFLNRLAESHFASLTFTDMQAESVELDLSLVSLNIQNVAPDAPPVIKPLLIKQEKPKKKQNKLKIIGVVHQSGTKFCVVQQQNKVNLSRSLKC